MERIVVFSISPWMSFNSQEMSEIYFQASSTGLLLQRLPLNINTPQPFLQFNLAPSIPFLWRRSPDWGLLVLRFFDLVLTKGSRTLGRERAVVRTLWEPRCGVKPWLQLSNAKTRYALCSVKWQIHQHMTAAGKKNQNLFFVKIHPARENKNSIIGISAFRNNFTRIFAVAFYGSKIWLNNLCRIPSLAIGALINVKVQALMFVVAIRDFRQISFRKWKHINLGLS